jgi:hypothetical protein
MWPRIHLRHSMNNRCPTFMFTNREGCISRRGTVLANVQRGFDPGFDARPVGDCSATQGAIAFVRLGVERYGVDQEVEVG